MHRVDGDQRRTAIMAYIAAFFDAHGHAPTYMEIARGLGFRSAGTVSRYLDTLEAQGYITKRWRSPRSILITPWAASAMSQDHQRTNQRIRQRLVKRR